MSNHSPTKKDPKKSETSKGKAEDSHKIEGLQPSANEGTTGHIQFLVDFRLAEMDWRGIITHRKTQTKEEFLGVDQMKITQFMKKYLSRVDTGSKEPPGEPLQPNSHLAEQQKKEAKEAPPYEMRTRSFSVIPAGTTYATGVMTQDQPLQLKWSFESGSISDIEENEQIHYKVIISRMKLPDGPLEMFSETTLNEKMPFRKTFDIIIPSEPLPPGTYRLEAQANFWSLKSKKPEWHSNLCKETCVIEVN
jgi:hypothetical protein